MGLPKATLPFGPELMLPRIVRLLREVVEPIVVVAAPAQQLPDLPADIIITRDEHEGRGPLEGLRAGLITMTGHAEAAYATSCDVPLLSVGFVQHLIALFGEHDVVVPIDGQFHHPLAAVYRTRVLPTIDDLLRDDRLRPAYLFDLVATLRVPVSDLEVLDPGLHTLMNLNRVEDYERALALAGLAMDDDVRKQLDRSPD